MAQRVKPVDPSSDEAAEIKSRFRELVNMAPREMERWLEREESKAVGQREPGGSTVGRRSARRIIAIKRKRAAELTAADIAHMKKVNGYIARHLKQRPKGSAGQLARTDWSHSLKNWGHDPAK